MSGSGIVDPEEGAATAGSGTKGADPVASVNSPITGRHMPGFKLIYHALVDRLVTLNSIVCGKLSWM